MRNVGEFERYFRSIGIAREPKVLDTLAARQTGRRVADELRGMRRPRGARGVGRELSRPHPRRAVPLPDRPLPRAATPG